MGRNINQLLMELENLDKDPDSCRAAMKALKSYVKDLDPKLIPMFLTSVSEIKDLSSSSGECVISLFEVLVRSHGRNVVPHIDNIMKTIVNTLSAAGSFSLQQSCSKVVLAIARYGITPLMLETEKARILSSLCKPLSDLLMGSWENVASGAALCLRALVESDNWRFASDDMVNEICLKVAGSLEETHTRTTSHMGLVMALSHHNSFVIDAYARSLVRSGLLVLTADPKESNSQKRLTAIQMINVLMKCVDSSSISSEIGKIADVMEKSQNDNMPFVRGWAFEALQTANIIAGHKASRHEASSSPLVGSSNRENNRSIPQVGNDDRGDGWYGNSPAECPSLESTTINSLSKNDHTVESPLSLGQSACNVERGPACNVERGLRATRRLWNSMGSFDAPVENLFSCEAASSNDNSVHRFAGVMNGELCETHRDHLRLVSGSTSPNVRENGLRASTPSPQRSRPQLNDSPKMYLAPQRPTGSLQGSSNAQFADYERPHSRLVMSPASVEVERNPRMSLDNANKCRNMNHAVEAKAKGSMSRQNTQQIVWDAEHITSGTEIPWTTGICPCMSRENNQQMVWDAEHITNGTEIPLTAGMCPCMSRDNNQQIVWDADRIQNCTKFPSASGIYLADCACTVTRKVGAQKKDTVQVTEVQRSRYGKTITSSLFVLTVFIAVILSVVWVNNNEVSPELVPT